MKKLFWLLVLALIWVYGSGFVSLGESGAIRFLNNWEQLSMDGDADAVCDLMHDDLEVSMDDRSSGGRPVRFEGGKKEFCEYSQQAIPALKLLLSSMQVTREDIEVKRDWLHPWTADVRYTERRSMSMPAAGLQLNTIGEDSLTLVKTFGGVKILRLDAKTWAERSE